MATSASSSAAARPQPKSLHTATPDDMKKLKDIIKDCSSFCMLTTQDETGSLRSRPMGVNGELEMVGQGAELTFFTYEDSHKCAEMHAHQNQVNLAFANPKNNSYLSISGTGRVVKDRAEMERRWSVIYKAWFPEGLDTKGIALLKVHIDAAEYWDSPSSTVAHAIGFIKSQLTGKQPVGIGEHEKLQMGDAAAKEGRFYSGEKAGGGQ